MHGGSKNSSDDPIGSFKFQLDVKLICAALNQHETKTTLEQINGAVPRWQRRSNYLPMT